MIYLAKSKRKNSLQEISEVTSLPLFYLSKVFQKLVKAKLIKSTKGPSGGFELVRNPNEITLSHIVQAIDGLELIANCGLGLKQCNHASPCCIHHEYGQFQRAVVQLFSNKTLRDIMIEYQDGKFEVLY